MITRRSLLGAMLAACAAPAYVKAGILMPVRKVLTPEWIGFDFGAGEWWTHETWIALLDGQVHHVVGVQRAVGTRESYVDGVLVGCEVGRWDGMAIIRDAR